MEIICSREGRLRDLKMNESDAFYLLMPRIREIAEAFNGKGNAGKILVLLACPCCDRDVFDYNRDIPHGTTTILCPLKEVDTGELECRYVVKKMKRAVPRTHDHLHFLTRLFRGGEPITLDSDEARNFLEDWSDMLSKETGYMAQ